jgi:hypothetical protein
MLFYNDNTFPYFSILLLINFIIFICDICWFGLFIGLYHLYPNDNSLYEYVRIELGLNNSSVMNIIPDANITIAETILVSTNLPNEEIIYNIDNIDTYAIPITNLL